MEPRVVLVTRPTAYEELLARHATHGQATWFLETRGLSIQPVLQAHNRQHSAVDTVLRAIPATWRQTRVPRSELDRFLFEPDDLIVAVGQDGLVPNVAKYLSEQPVIGINPDPGAFEGVLVRHPPSAARDLLNDVYAGRMRFEHRTMVRARTDDGQELLALNEIFVGQPSHQSARYRIQVCDDGERQSSSGLIVATGTGCTGWARSIHTCHRCTFDLPGSTDPSLVLFVREAWPSVATSTDITEGLVEPGTAVEITSEMENGRIFGDGIEQDPIVFPWGRQVTIDRAPITLRLV